MVKLRRLQPRSTLAEQHGDRVEERSFSTATATNAILEDADHGSGGKEKELARVIVEWME